MAWGKTVWCGDCGLFYPLFSSLAKEPNLSFLDHMPKSINEGMLRMLDVEFTQEVVISGIRKMHPTKVPGLDGMTTIFYQNFWDIVL